MSETAKAHARRTSENWFAEYAPSDNPGIDLGCQHDPIYPDNPLWRKWDVIFGDPDATYMEGVADDSYQTVYASHLLEHLADPVTALRNWYRICAPGGHVIVIVPHRDLYEKRTTLPSRWNGEHKSFYLPNRAELPITRSLHDTITEAIPSVMLPIQMRTLDAGWQDLGPDVHSVGEYSIEAIIRKAT